MEKESIINATKEWYGEGNQTKENAKQYYDRYYKNILFNIRGKVLSIGEGEGWFLDYLGIENATIVDLVEPKKEFGYQFIKRDLNKDLNIKEKYDTIFITEVLEHLINPMKLMKEVYDILSDNGRVYISVPYTEIDKDSKDILTHKHRWKDYQIRNQLASLGFKVKFLLKRRRFKGMGFWLPHCFLIIELKK